MAEKTKKRRSSTKNIKLFLLAGSVVYLLIILYFITTSFVHAPASYTAAEVAGTTTTIASSAYLPIDTADYDRRMLALANNPVITVSTTTRNASGTLEKITSTTTKKTGWPVPLAYPQAGAILPFKRIVAYYGNFYSKNMGVLGQYPQDQVLSMLQDEVTKWNAADPSTPVLPAIQYIAITAQGYAGADGKYRLRMPDDQIQKAIDMAHAVQGITILDVQPGQSTVEAEVPTLEKYLEMPDVHLAIDPEFAMKPGQVPGVTYIGTLDATDINFVINYLAKIVDTYHLPPKVLVVHRFTGDMVTHSQNIKPVPEVQVVMNMDGWGAVPNKTSIYDAYVAEEPVEFTGIKLFYKNDTKPGSTLMTPAQALNLAPKPIYIQYQ